MGGVIHDEAKSELHNARERYLPWPSKDTIKSALLVRPESGKYLVESKEGKTKEDRLYWCSIGKSETLNQD